ncbi:MAG TPA: hypothetical protein VFQ80_16980, partial [Thermomicrobiales bacterium]|nr:hypothetical protein [Thermomicrobiales bacterium]
EGQRWLEQALATPADAAGARPRAWALMGSGVLASVSGKTERAAAVLTESLRWWKSTGDSAGYAFASSLLGGVYVSQGRYDEAAPLFAANRDYFREADHASMLAHADFHLGLIAWMRGDAVGARGLLRESAEGYDRAGARTNAINPLRYLGLAACAAGEPEEAVRWFREEWARLRQLRSLAALGVGLADVAALAAARQAWRPAARLFAKAEALLQAEAAAFSLPARDHYQRGRDRAWEALGAAAAEAAAAGQALTLEQAMLEAEAVLQLDGEAGAGATPAPQRER